MAKFGICWVALVGKGSSRTKFF